MHLKPHYTGEPLPISTNYSPLSLYIDWDSSTFVNPSDESCRILHSGVKFADRNASLPLSVIAPNSTLTDIVMLSENVSWREGSKNIPGGWEFKPLFSRWEKADEINFRIMLSLKIENESKPYEIGFIVIEQDKDKRLKREAILDGKSRSVQIIGWVILGLILLGVIAVAIWSIFMSR